MANELEIEILTEGKGEIADEGHKVSVHYEGQLTDGTVFDASRPRGEAFSFSIGAGQVIPGWEQGVTGMKLGEIRKLTIPPELGYGASGAGDVIPPNATLIFSIELLDVSMPATLGEGSAKDLLDEQANGTIIIDIRRDDEWHQTGIIKGAHTITAFQNNGNLHPDFRDMFFSLVEDPNTPIMIYCKSGGRSRMLGHALIDQLGFSNVKHLSGGITGWIENGHETEDYKGQ
jgi:rhodanese-related sulfurtransferase